MNLRVSPEVKRKALQVRKRAPLHAPVTPEEAAARAQRNAERAAQARAALGQRWTLARPLNYGYRYEA